ncbi:hypothetical protein P5V15_014208 [Pogonomyrmex californicus]
MNDDLELQIVFFFFFAGQSRGTINGDFVFLEYSSAKIQQRYDDVVLLRAITRFIYKCSGVRLARYRSVHIAYTPLLLTPFKGDEELVSEKLSAHRSSVTSILV